MAGTRAGAALNPKRWSSVLMRNTRLKTQQAIRFAHRKANSFSGKRYQSRAKHER